MEPSETTDETALCAETERDEENVAFDSEPADDVDADPIRSLHGKTRSSRVLDNPGAWKPAFDPHRRMERHNVKRVVPVPQELKIHYEIILDANFDEFQGKTEALVQSLKTVSTDPELTLTSTRRGSLVLVLEGSQEGFDKIVEKITSGELTAVAGVRIIGVRRVTHAAGNGIKVSEELQVDPADDSRQTGRRGSYGREPTSSSLRGLIEEVMRGDAALEAFLFGYFRKVANEVGPRMSRTDKINLLFCYATSAEIFRDLQISFPEEVARHSHLLKYKQPEMNDMVASESY